MQDEKQLNNVCKGNVNSHYSRRKNGSKNYIKIIYIFYFIFFLYKRLDYNDIYVEIIHLT